MQTQDVNKVLAYSHLGIVFAVVLGGSVFLGLKLDERLETSPLFTLVGVFFGFGAGLWHLYRSVYGPGGAAGKNDGPDETNG